MYHFLNSVNPLLVGIQIQLWLSAKKGRTTLDGPYLFLSLLWSVLWASFLAMVLLEASSFRLHTFEAVTGGANALLFVANAWIWHKKRPRFDVSTWRPSATGLAAVAVILLGISLRFPLSRYAFGGQDQGTYVILARLMARTGRVIQHDPVAKRILNDNHFRALRKNYSRFRAGTHLEVPHRYEGAVMPGFYLGDRSQGTVVPQFFHLHPAWMAMWGWWWTPVNGVWSLIFFSLLGLLSIWLLGTSLFSSRALALGALAFLAVNILQVWTSRYPLSEIPTQALALAGLAALGLAETKESPGAALAGGLAIGLTFFARISSIFWLPVLFMSYVLLPTESAKRTSHRIFHISALGTALWGLLHHYILSYPYMYDLFRKRLHIPLKITPERFALVGVLLLGGMILATELLHGKVLWHQYRKRMRKAERFLVPAAAALLAAITILGVTYRIVLTPLKIPHGRFWIIQRVHQLSLFVSWPILATGLIGLGSMAAHPRRTAKLIGFAGLWFVLLVLIYKPYNRYAFYYCRYYVSELLFGLALGSTWAILQAWRWAGARRRLTRIAGHALLAGLVGYVAAFQVRGHLTNPAFRTDEMAGSWQEMERIASLLPKGAIVVVHRAGPKGPGFHLMAGISLEFSYGHPVIRANRLHGIPRQVHDLGRPVFLLEIASRPRRISCDARHVYQLVGQGRFRYHHSAKVLGRPTDVAESRRAYFLYRLHDASSYRLRPDERTLPVPSEGLWPWESTHAWTKGKVVLYGLPVAPNRPTRLTFLLRGIFPTKVRCKVEVETAGKVIFSKDYEGKDLRSLKTVGPVTLPPTKDGRITVTLRSCTWRPSEVRGTKDRRLLGLDLAWIRLEAL